MWRYLTNYLWSSDVMQLQLAAIFHSKLMKLLKLGHRDLNEKEREVGEKRERERERDGKIN